MWALGAVGGISAVRAAGRVRRQGLGGLFWKVRAHQFGFEDVLGGFMLPLLCSHSESFKLVASKDVVMVFWRFDVFSFLSSRIAVAGHFLHQWAPHWLLEVWLQ